MKFTNHLTVIEKSYSYAKSLSTGKPEKVRINSELSDDTLYVRIFNYPMNCCIDSIGCSPELDADTLIMRVKEHFVEICECFTKFDIKIKIYPVQGKPNYFRIYKDDLIKPCFEGKEEL
ncbi:MAG: hypothetical protein ACPL6C_03255 [bacterium]